MAAKEFRELELVGARGFEPPTFRSHGLAGEGALKQRQHPVRRQEVVLQHVVFGRRLDPEQLHEGFVGQQRMTVGRPDGEPDRRVGEQVEEEGDRIGDRLQPLLQSVKVVQRHARGIV